MLAIVPVQAMRARRVESAHWSVRGFGRRSGHPLATKTTATRRGASVRGAGCNHVRSRAAPAHAAFSSLPALGDPSKIAGPPTVFAAAVTLQTEVR